MPTLNEICKSINTEKNTELLDEYNQSDYIPFVVNRIFSLHPDTVLYANEMNAYPYLEKEIQYKFFLYGVRKRSRYAPWLKYILPEDIQIIKKYYGYSTKQAKRVQSLFSKNDIEEIKRLIDTGGIR